MCPRTEKKLRKKLLLEQKAQEDKREQNLENSLNKEELQEIEFAKLIINQTNKTLPKPIKLDSLFSALTENWNVEKSELEKEELFFEDIHEDN
eukprot:gene3194-5510_t